MDWTTLISSKEIIIAFLLSAEVDVFFGFYPVS
jgi:hypothetical protein